MIGFIKSLKEFCLSSGTILGKFFSYIWVYMLKSKNSKCLKGNKTSGVMESVKGGGYYFNYGGHRKPLLVDIAFELNEEEIIMQKFRVKGAASRKNSTHHALELGCWRNQEKALVFTVNEVREYLEMWSELSVSRSYHRP